MNKFELRKTIGLPLSFDEARDINSKWEPSACKPVYRVDITLYRHEDGSIGARQIGTTQVIPDGAPVYGDYRCGIGFSSDIARLAYEQYLIQEVTRAIFS